MIAPAQAEPKRETYFNRLINVLSCFLWK